MGNRDEEALRRFVACREAGDGDGMRDAWSSVVELLYDRVDGMVDAWSYKKAKLSDDEHEEAVSRVLTDVFEKLVRTFAGTSVGELVNAVRTLVHFRCSDVVDASIRRREHELSYDAVRTDEEGGGSELHPGELDAAEARMVRNAEAAEAREFVSWGLERLTNPRQRIVIERTLDGVPAEEIADELGVSMDNLYQLRSRALRAMRTSQGEQT